MKVRVLGVGLLSVLLSVLLAGPALASDELLCLLPNWPHC